MSRRTTASPGSRFTRSVPAERPVPSSQAPVRPISIDSTSAPPASSAAATLRAEATEISCSLERPPDRTAIRGLKESTAEAFR